MAEPVPLCGDPSSWDAEQLLEYLYDPAQTWSTRSKPPLPPFEDLAKILRDEDIGVETLLMPSATSWLKDQAGLTYGQFASINYAIAALRSRCLEYQGKVHDGHLRALLSPSERDSPKPGAEQISWLSTPLKLNSQSPHYLPSPQPRSPERLERTVNCRANEILVEDSNGNKRRKLTVLSTIDRLTQVDHPFFEVGSVEGGHDRHNSLEATRASRFQPNESNHSPANDIPIPPNEGFTPPVVDSPFSASPRATDHSLDGEVPSGSPDHNHENGNHAIEDMSMREAGLDKGYLGPHSLPVDMFFFGPTKDEKPLKSNAHTFLSTFTRGTLDKEHCDGDDNGDNNFVILSAGRISSGRRIYAYQLMNRLFRSPKVSFSRGDQSFVGFRPYPLRMLPKSQQGSFILVKDCPDPSVSTRQRALDWPEFIQASSNLPKSLNVLRSSGEDFISSLAAKWSNQDDNFVHPLFNESGSEGEYDSETWAEMDEEQGLHQETTRSAKRAPKRSPLPAQEVSKCIDRAEHEVISRWNGTKLKRLERKAFSIWIKNLNRRQPEIETKQARMDAIQSTHLPRIRAEIQNQSWFSSMALQRLSSNALEPFLYERQELQVTIDILKSEIAPKKFTMDTSPKTVNKRPYQVDGAETSQSEFSDPEDLIDDQYIEPNTISKFSNIPQASTSNPECVPLRRLKGHHEIDVIDLVDSSDDASPQQRSTQKSSDKIEDSIPSFQLREYRINFLKDVFTKYPKLRIQIVAPAIESDSEDFLYHQAHEALQKIARAIQFPDEEPDFDSRMIRKVCLLELGWYFCKPFKFEAIRSGSRADKKSYVAVITSIASDLERFRMFVTDVKEAILFLETNAAPDTSPRSTIMPTSEIRQHKSPRVVVPRVRTESVGSADIDVDSRVSIETSESGAQRPLFRKATTLTIDRSPDKSTETIVTSTAPSSPRRKRKRAITEDAQAARERAKHAERAEEYQRVQSVQNLSLADAQSIAINPIEMDPGKIINIHPYIAASIKRHQIEGVQFLWRELVHDGGSNGCLLAHTMGLGKTLCVITLLVTLSTAAKSPDQEVSSLIPEHLRHGRVLILCPPTLIDNWIDEFTKWTPYPRENNVGTIRTITSSLSYRLRESEIQAWFEQGGILMMGYEMFKSLANGKNSAENLAEEASPSQLRKMLLEGPSIIVADEAHKMKNSAAKITQLASLLKSKSRIALTGSPLNNNIEEYFTMVDWVSPRYLGDRVEFRANFVEPIRDGLWFDSTSREISLSKRKLKTLSAILEPKVHRADISVLKGDISSKTEFVIQIALTSVQKRCYQQYVRDVQAAVNDDRSPQISRVTLLAWLGILSLLCAHPFCYYLKMKGAPRSRDELLGSLNRITSEDAIDVPVEPSAAEVPLEDAVLTEEQNATHLSKLADLGINKTDSALSNRTLILEQILKLSAAVKDKVLVFSQSLWSLDLLEGLLQRLGLKYDRIDGSTPMHTRQQKTKTFGHDDSFDVCLISTRAGGVGLNFQGANRVVLFDFGFNPSWEEQAVGRAYRIGQRKPVYVYRFRAGGTFEDHMHNTQVFKMQLATRVVDKKTPRRHAKRDMDDMFFEPTEVNFEDLSTLRGRDPHVLDHILDGQTDERSIYAIELSETFQAHVAEFLSAEEELAAKTEVEEERLRISNPMEYKRLKADQSQKRLQETARGRASWPSPATRGPLGHLALMPRPFSPQLSTSSSNALQKAEGQAAAQPRLSVNPRERLAQLGKMHELQRQSLAINSRPGVLQSHQPALSPLHPGLRAHFHHNPIAQPHPMGLQTPSLSDSIDPRMTILQRPNPPQVSVVDDGPRKSPVVAPHGPMET